MAAREGFQGQRQPDDDELPSQMRGSGSCRHSQSSLSTTLDSERKGRKSGFDFRSFMPERTHADIAKRYDINPQEYASGGYGKVFLARDREFGQKKVAIKKVVKHSDPKKQEAFHREIKIMKELDHPNICKLLETYDEHRNLFFVMECCEGGEVFQRIIDSERIAEQHAADVIKQVASALRYAHARGIAHRDLKPENVCFCDRDPESTLVKVIDWGLGFYFGQARMSSAVGSLTYAAPEVLEGGPGKEYGKECDLWSLGVLSYVMLCGKPPFWGNHNEQLRRMKQERYPCEGPPWDSTSLAGKDLIQKLLRKEPKNRLPIEKVTEHEWFKSSAKASPMPEDDRRQVLANMQQFKNSSVFFSMCVTSVARQLDHSSLKNVHKVFAEMDANGDGVLELKEVKEGFEKMFGKGSVEANQVEDMFQKLDLDGSGTIDYTEFCAAGIGEQMSSQEHVLWAAFKAFDNSDDNDEISKEELSQVLQSASVQKAWSKEVCDIAAQEIIEKFDVDNSGTISFDEWLEMMQDAQVKQVRSERPLRESRRTEQELQAELERAAQHGNIEEAYQLLRKLNMKAAERRDADAGIKAPVASQKGGLRSFTDKLARAFSTDNTRTPVCGFDTSRCSVM